MKKLFTLIALTFLIHANTNAQGYFEMSYRFGKYSCDNLNRSVYVYNYTRQWLDAKMDYFGSGHGISAAYGQQYSPLGWKLGFTNFHEQHIAHGLEPTTGQIAYRQFRYFDYALYFAIPVRIVNTEHLEVTFSPSLDMNFPTVGLSYTHDATPKSWEETENAVGTTKLGTTLSLAVKLYPVRWLGVSVKPFISFKYHPTDMEGIQNTLQGANYETALTDPLTIKGISLSISFAHRDW